jgi:Coenzyme PQQ synthesis protein D (PqqD)
MRNTVYRRAVDLMEASLGDELVALDVRAGQCFGFNGVATSVWRWLEQPKSFEQLHDALLADYDVGSDQCLGELAELLDDLVSKGLVVRG